MAEDIVRQIILRHLLKRADAEYGIHLDGTEPVAEGWAQGLDLTLPVRRPLVEIGDELDVPPPGAQLTVYYCGCDRHPIPPIGEAPPRVRHRTEPVLMFHQLWASPDGRTWDAWIGQCPECHTIYWRVQQQTY